MLTLVKESYSYSITLVIILDYIAKVNHPAGFFLHFVSNACMVTVF